MKTILTAVLLLSFTVSAQAYVMLYDSKDVDFKACLTEQSLKIIADPTELVIVPGNYGALKGKGLEMTFITRKQDTDIIKSYQVMLEAYDPQGWHLGIDGQEFTYAAREMMPTAVLKNRKEEILGSVDVTVCPLESF